MRPSFALHFQYGPKLRFIELPVDAVLGEQGFVVSLLADDAALHHKDFVRLEDRGQPMRDDDTGSALHQMLQGLLDGVF